VPGSEGGKQSGGNSSITQNPFSKETSRLILEIVGLSAQMHTNLDKCRRKIKQDNISVGTMFEGLQLQNCGYVTSEDLRQLLQDNGINCEPKDLKCLMKLFNKRVNERISLPEFTNFVDF
jgi:Ca2+-binding EF-hand superfamily protein